MTDELEANQEALNPESEADTQNTDSADNIDGAEELKKVQENYKSQKIRAEKAEQELKALKKTLGEKKEEATPTKADNISWKDARILQDVHDDDVQEVIDFANYKGISIPDAKKHPVIQTLLREHAEERKSALAANTGGGRRGVAQASDDAILSDFEKGKVSDKDEDIERLAEARLNARIKNRK